MHLLPAPFQLSTAGQDENTFLESSVLLSEILAG